MTSTSISRPPRLGLHFPDAVERRRPVGDNPPKGAILYYYLKAKPAEKEEITLDMLTRKAKRVRHFSNLQENKHEQPPEWPDLELASNLLPAEAGINRFAWDFRSDPPVQIPGAFYRAMRREARSCSPESTRSKLPSRAGPRPRHSKIVIDPRIENQVDRGDCKSNSNWPQGASGH